MVLHCNGDLAEARPVAEGAPELSGKALERADRALDCVRACDALDIAAARAEFDAVFAAG
jgi:beta-N-acetylhexosaminidase